MEKELSFDQEVIVININDEVAPESLINNLEEISADDYTVADESEIDWSTL